MTTRLRPRTQSFARSEAAARTVSTISLDRSSLPAVGECRIRKATPGYGAEFNTGAPLFIVSAFGSTPEEAERNARARAADLLCPLCSEPLNGEKFFHLECAKRENALADEDADSGEWNAWE